MAELGARTLAPSHLEPLLHLPLASVTSIGAAVVLARPTAKLNRTPLLLVVVAHVVLALVRHEGLPLEALDFLHAQRALIRGEVGVVELGLLLGEHPSTLRGRGELDIEFDLVLALLAPSLNLDDLLLAEKSPILRLAARHGLHTRCNVTVLLTLATALLSGLLPRCLLPCALHHEATLLCRGQLGLEAVVLATAPRDL